MMVAVLGFRVCSALESEGLRALRAWSVLYMEFRWLWRILHAVGPRVDT